MTIKKNLLRRYVALSLKLQLQLVKGDGDLLTWTAATIHTAVSTLIILLFGGFLLTITNNLNL